jgi:two-component system cell cycle response regulator
MGGRILIVDGLPTNRILLKVKLAAVCYDVLQADDPDSALRLIAHTPPDLVLANVALPGPGGIGLCRTLRSSPLTRHIPVILLAPDGAPDRTADTRLAALEAGADDILSRPLDDAVLLARVRNLLRARDTGEELRLREGTNAALGFSEPPAGFEPAARIALVAPDARTGHRWKSALAALTPHLLQATDRNGALSDGAPGRTPDVFVVAADLDRPADGLELLAELRARSGTRYSPVIVVQDAGRDGGADDLTARALDLGASDLMPCGFEPRELALRLAAQVRHKRQDDRLRAGLRDGLRAAVTDPLTGLYNRRYGLPHLRRVRDTAMEKGRPFSVMLADLDHFKAINDRYGHAAGDVVLRDVAERLRVNLRVKDLVARIGGEEFLIVMPDTPRDQASHAARRLCGLIHETPVTVPGQAGPVPVSISIGVTVAEPDAQGVIPDVDALMALADTALYAAKTEGRNRVTLSPCAA